MCVPHLHKHYTWSEIRVNYLSSYKNINAKYIISYHAILYTLFLLCFTTHTLLSESQEPLWLHNQFYCCFNHLQDAGLDRAGKSSCWPPLWDAVFMWIPVTTWNPWRVSDQRAEGSLGGDDKSCNWAVKTSWMMFYCLCYLVLVIYTYELLFFFLFTWCVMDYT